MSISSEMSASCSLHFMQSSASSCWRFRLGYRLELRGFYLMDIELVYCFCCCLVFDSCSTFWDLGLMHVNWILGFRWCVSYRDTYVLIVWFVSSKACRFPCRFTWYSGCALYLFDICWLFVGCCLVVVRSGIHTYYH